MPRKFVDNRSRLILKGVVCLVLNLAFSLSLVALFSVIVLKNPELMQNISLIGWICLGLSAVVCGVFSVLFCRENLFLPPAICLLSGVLLLGVTLLVSPQVNGENFFVRFCVFSVLVLFGGVLGLLLQNRRSHSLIRRKKRVSHMHRRR